MKALSEITPLRDGGFTCGEFLANLCNLRFESDVIPDSGQTLHRWLLLGLWFESDVIPDSGQTSAYTPNDCGEFESDVIPDSGQTSCM